MVTVPRRHPADSGESGQATLEYVLLIAVVVGFFAIATSQLERLGVGAKILKPLNTDFANAYKYGHPKARGYDEGEPEMHPRIETRGNFRIFINPQVRK